MEKLTITALRNRLYKVVDEVLETGVPVEIERNGKTVVIVPGQRTGSRLAGLERRNGIVGDPDDLAEIRVGEWREPKNLT